MNSDPTTQLESQAVDLAPRKDPGSMSEWIPRKNTPRVDSDQPQREREENLPCEMANLAEESAAFGERVPIDNRSRELSARAKILVPSATHLIATIEGSMDDAYADEYDGYTPTSGEPQVSGLVPGLGKWV